MLSLGGKRGVLHLRGSQKRGRRERFSNSATLPEIRWIRAPRCRTNKPKVRCDLRDHPIRILKSLNTVNKVSPRVLIRSPSKKAVVVAVIERRGCPTASERLTAYIYTINHFRTNAHRVKTESGGKQFCQPRPSWVKPIAATRTYRCAS